MCALVVRLAFYSRVIVLVNIDLDAINSAIWMKMLSRLVGEIIFISNSKMNSSIVLLVSHISPIT